MASYRCKNCRYSLESVKEIKKCPYCDKNSLEKEKSASELLDDIVE